MSRDPNKTWRENMSKKQSKLSQYKKKKNDEEEKK